MVSEWTLVWQAIPKLLPTSLFGLCYIIGGRKWKWVRRYLGPVVFTASCAILAQVFGCLSWKVALLLFYCPILTLGYSKDFSRIIYTLALAGIGVLLGLVYGQLAIGILQGVLALVIGVFFTITHPIEAVDEEFLIAVLSVLIVPFMVL